MTLFGFGHIHPDYTVRVLNEREVRAGAGILLFFAMIAFLTSFHTGDFTLTRIAIVAFGLDFAIRLFVSPDYAPSLVLGRYMVRKQVPEWTGAPQKRFAWGLGLGLAGVMFVFLILFNQINPILVLGCLACILLLFFESAFGICLGCWVYDRLWPGVAQACPGGVCSIETRDPVTFVRPAHLASVAAVAVVVGVATPVILHLPAPQMPFMAAADDPDRCVVPEFAIRIGHEAQWRAHNGC